MILTLKNSEGYIIAYSESERVNIMGLINDLPDSIRIENFWIHPNYRNKETIAKLVTQLYEHPLYRRCKIVYWQILRDENGVKIIDDTYTKPFSKRLSKLYSRDKLYKKLTGDEYVKSNIANTLQMSF